MTIITVKAAPGVRVPYEDNARKYITKDKPVAVQETAYYLRRLADRDLVLCEVETAADKPTPAPADAASVPGKTSAQADQAKAPTDASTDPTDADQVAPVAGARARTTKTKGA